jgi:hypothetical protein
MIEAIYTGPERVECRGAVHTGPNAEGDCARSLIGAGVEPSEAIEFCRGGMAQLCGTVEAFAGRAWGGADADPQFRRWRPHPKGDYPDLLLQWHALRLTGRPGGPARRHGRERGSAVSALS